MSLFSVFDPVVLGGQFNWIVLLVVFMFISLGIYVSGLGVTGCETVCMKGLEKLFSDIAYPNHLGLSNVVVGVFFYLALMNLLGLVPFIFTSTAHPVFTMGLGLVFWVSFVIMGWIMSVKESMAHLVPEGSPLLLSPVLVVIELVSHLIRPFTLSIRLAANMMAGHLIMGLMSMISLFSFSNFMVSCVMQGVLLILELAVAIIQGFVFSILVLLYALDYY